MPISSVLLDLDGTLIDSIPLILESFVRAFEAVGLPVPAADELRGALGIPLTVFFERLTGDAGVTEAMIVAYRAYNLEHHDARVTAYPGIVEMMRGLRSRGLRVAIVTSKHRATAWRGLRVTGIDDTVNVVIGSDDVTRPKPDREPVDRALAELGDAPDGAVFVGDSLHDLASARAAGVRGAAALWGPFTREDLQAGQPDHWLESPAALLALVDGSGRRGREFPLTSDL